MACNHRCYNWELVYRCRNCGEIVDESDATRIDIKLDMLEEQLTSCHHNVHDLLDACEAALAHITGNGRDGTYGEYRDNPVPKQLRAAIAKAKGGNP